MKQNLLPNNVEEWTGLIFGVVALLMAGFVIVAVIYSIIMLTWTYAFGG